MDTKTALESSVIVNGLIGFLVLIANLLGLDLDEGILTELVMGLIGLYAVVRVIIGRINARTQISGVV